MNAKYPVILVLLLLAANTTFAAEPEDFARIISVSGTAVTMTVPDLIVWRITTSDFDKELLPAKESSDKKLQAILGLADRLEVEPDDVQTGHLRIERQYERDRHGNRTEFKHFAVIRSVTLKQRDLKRFDEFLSRFVSSAEMEVNFGLESSRIHELRAETRLKAVRIAKEKAAAMVGEVGAKLGKIRTLDEYKRPELPPYGGFGGAASNVAYFDAASALAPDVSTGTFAPGAIEVRVTVYATFEIE